MVCSTEPWIVDNVKSSEPDREGSVHEGDDALHLLQTDTSQVTEPEPADIVDDGDPRDLRLDLPGHHLQQDVGRGIEVLKTDSVWVPVA